MSNHWKTPDIPHKGWVLMDVIDVKEYGQPEDETDYESCMMCGNEKIRYVHILTHSEVDEDFRVGCICAENMTGDYVNPKKYEGELKKKATRRKSWVERTWKVSAKGNSYMNVEGHILTIFKDRTNKYKCSLDREVGELSHPSLKAAKNALYSKMEHMKANGSWYE